MKSKLLSSLTALAGESLELSESLETVCNLLNPYVEVDAVGIVRVEGGQIQPHEIHVRGVPRNRADSVWRMLADYLGTSDHGLQAKAHAIYDDPRSGLATILRDGAMQVVNLVLERHFPEDQMFYEHGVRSYIRISIADAGVLEFFRLQHGAPAVAFTQEEAALLEEVAPAIADALR